jgi:hypothetical protein
MNKNYIEMRELMGLQGQRLLNVTQKVWTVV